jgi:hypothetical protein
VALTDALVGGGIALAGVALQQLFTLRADTRRYDRERRDRAHDEQHAAFVDLIRTARRMQRVLADLGDRPADLEARARLSEEVDRLAEAVSVIRLVVVDAAGVVEAAEDFEAQAKRLEQADKWDNTDVLQLTPLIKVLQGYEINRVGSGGDGPQ